MDNFILENKIPKCVKKWTLILKITTIIFITFMFIPYNSYKDYIGYVSLEENNSYIYFDKEVYLNKNLYIEGKKYEYEVVDISDYIKIKIDLEDSLKVNSIYLNVSIRSNRKTLFDVLKNKIKKGLGL